ncbi:MAG: linearmycin/streptolysin transport system ATP-binding protein [Acidobacteriota bacterium]|jgi:ABC-2 type transport system ATP-binding protein|nr:linearmycin/streptolysin transport system ATP-binding protein [Acidobacteriota bacterium]
MIRVDGLVKRFGDIHAVDGVSFSVEAGEIYGLLGPNGAGKTTTFSMLAGLLAPDSGRVTVGGVDLASDPLGVKRGLGVVPQEVAVYEELTARENLGLWGGLYGLSGSELAAAVERALDEVGLAGRSREPVQRFSGGMKRRLNLSLGLIHRPKAVLLDEPTVGIDPQARNNILEVVRKTADAGAAIVYTTHYLEEAERLCDRIGIIDHGKLLAEGTLAELKALVAEEEVVTLFGGFDPATARAEVERLPGVKVLVAEAGKLAFSSGGKGAAGLLGQIFGRGLDVDRVSIEPPSLNGLFLKLTGRELRD